MSPDMEAVWRRFYQEGKRRIHCDIHGLFVVWAGLQDSSIQQCESVINVCSPDSWKCLGAWLPLLRAKPHYRIDLSGKMLVSPRIWHILNMASRENSRVVDTANFLQAVLDERRSIPARYMAEDRKFLKKFGLDYREDGCANGHVRRDHRNDSLFLTPAISPDAPPEEEKEISEESYAAHGEEVSLLLCYLERFETIILGFLEDAIRPESPIVDFRFPGEDAKLSELWRQKDMHRLAQYLDLLKEYLIGVMAAHRDAAIELETEVSEKVKGVLKSPAHGSRTSFILRDTAEEVRSAVLDVLKGVELEGLPGQLIREKIRKLSIRTYGIYPRSCS